LGHNILEVEDENGVHEEEDNNAAYDEVVEGNSEVQLYDAEDRNVVINEENDEVELYDGVVLYDAEVLYDGVDLYDGEVGRHDVGHDEEQSDVEHDESHDEAFF
jgi:hypothetical protein